VEDYSGRSSDTIYERGLARERVLAAAEIAHAGSVRMVLTARAENHIRGREDLGDTIERLQSYQEARVSVGGAFAFAALGALCEAAAELRDRGTYGYLERTASGVRAARSAFQ
jgi:hypothetical protein